MKKSLLFLLLFCSIVMICSLISCGIFDRFSQPTPSEGLSFELSTDGTYYILTGRGTCTDTKIVVPSEHEGKPVKEITYGSEPLNVDELLEELVILEGVTHISKNAFQRFSNLKSITLPESLEVIGQNAFYGTLIKDVYIKDLRSWLKVDGYIPASSANYYINGKLLTTLKIPRGVTQIKDNAFGGCISLENVTITNGVKTIGNGAFMRCENLKSVHISNTVLSIGMGAFSSCYSLEKIDIPNSVTNIGQSAFQDNFALTRVTLGKNLESIEGNAFGYCYSLFEICNKSSMELEKGSEGNGSVAKYARLITSDSNHSNLTTIADFVFYKSNEEAYLLYYKGNDKYLVLPDINQEYKICEFAFAEIKHEDYVNGGIESIVLPEYVIEIGKRVFYRCDNLKSVEIRGNIPNIEEYTFYGCLALENVILPKSITSIDDEAFGACSMLQSIEIPDSVTYIGDSAFSSCYSLTSIVIPDSVTGIGKSAFRGCSGLESVTFSKGLEVIPDFAFSGCTRLVILDIPYPIQCIGKSAFENCASLVSVTLPSSLTQIKDNAFHNCIALIEICEDSPITIYQYPNGDYSIHHGYIGAFAKHIISDASESFIKYEGDFIFYDDGTNVYLLKYIGDDTEIALPEYDGGREYEIYTNFLCYDNQITSVTIPRFVTKLNYRSFYCCSSLESIKYEGTVEEWDAFNENHWHDDYLDYRIICIDGTLTEEGYD